MSRLCLLAVAALSGCSLILDFGEEGLPCNAAGECLEGYVCDKNDQCMPIGSETTLCSPDPTCGDFGVCVKASCKPVCEKNDRKRGCKAGEFCDDTAGTCRAVEASSRGFGIPCTADGDCDSVAAGTAKCLRPYGGGQGLCTIECATDGECGAGRANKCLEFVAAHQRVKVCAPPAFLPCTKESDCAGSSLSCGMFAFEGKQVALMACRERIDGGGSIGERCNAQLKCGNGLCLPAAGAAAGGANGVCTTPCVSAADCVETADAAHKNDAFCEEVTFQPGTSRLPRVRPKLCMIGDRQIGFPCQSSSMCAVDAPECVTFETTTGEVTKCEPACSDDTKDKCPSGSTCWTSGVTPGGQWCGPPR